MSLYQLGDEALIAHFRQDSAEEATPKLLAELVRRFQEETVKECYQLREGPRRSARRVAGGLDPSNHQVPPVR